MWRRARFRTTRRYVDGDALVLVAELTSSSTRGADWEDNGPRLRDARCAGLSAAGHAGRVRDCLLGAVREGLHLPLTVPFGKTLRVPAPFDCELDTNGFGAPVEQQDGEPAADSGPAEDYVRRGRSRAEPAPCRT